MKSLCFRYLALLAALVVLASCASIPRSEFTATDLASAQVLSFENIRFYADDKNFLTRMADLDRSNGTDTPMRFLALSGGGSAGAFGAGLLTGWSERGDRPQFDVVTGVSAGALIAPFAFLGAAHDPDLRELFTSGVAEELLQIKLPLRGLLGESLSSGQPLFDLVSRHVDRRFLDEIAEAHREGRRLFVVTTNLDSQRSVVWDMGAIAAVPGPASVDLFRRVLVASASIPALFPAVRINVSSGGKNFEELHSDGGVTRQIFILPDAAFVAGTSAARSQQRKRELYLIVNNEFSPQFEIVEDKTIAVAARAYSTIVKASAQSTINATYALARQNGVDFNMAFVDVMVPYKQSDPFNTTYMRTLYKLGFEKGINRDWYDAPPLGQMLEAGPELIAER